MKHGDFSALAEDYAATRPDYSERVLAGVLGMCSKATGALDVVDVGAGTGIWTLMLAQSRVGSVTAVEPNDEMRGEGIRHTEGSGVTWRAGTAESTGLPEGSADLLTMASAFHWAEFDLAVAEFSRILREDGVFVALWNPRLVFRNPVLQVIEDHVAELLGGFQPRVSSGFSTFTDGLGDRLRECGFFREFGYLENEHVIKFDHERYLGVWRSVNDVRVQLGEERFSELLSFVESAVAEMDHIEATYLTRAWLARKG
jgi:SAM-dependent methyltransferase